MAVAWIGERGPKRSRGARTAVDVETFPIFLNGCGVIYVRGVKMKIVISSGLGAMKSEMEGESTREAKRARATNGDGSACGLARRHLASSRPGVWAAVRAVRAKLDSFHPIRPDWDRAPDEHAEEIVAYVAAERMT